MLLRQAGRKLTEEAAGSKYLFYLFFNFSALARCVVRFGSKNSSAEEHSATIVAVNRHCANGADRVF